MNHEVENEIILSNTSKLTGGLFKLILKLKMYLTAGLV